jgi:arylsulfatase A-like enzyme
MDVNQSFHRARLSRSFWEGVAETRVVRRAYEDGMRALDAQIGSLFVELERRGVLDRTVVVITSDHGESFGAGQGDDHDPAGHGSSLYPEQSRIPLVVVSPRLAARGGSVGSVVSTRQLAGTVTHLAGAKASPFPGERLPGIEDAGGGVVGGGAALLTLNYEDRRLRALVWDRWLYIGDMVRRPPVEELYDLSSDPSARRNLGDRDPMVPRLRALAQQLLDGAERK